MCQLCLLGADSDVLVSIWQHVPSRVKVCELVHLCRCERVRQSLLPSAAYAHDEVHIPSSTTGADDIAKTLAAVRVPLALSHVRTLIVTFIGWPSQQPISFGQFGRPDTIGRSDTTSAARQQQLRRTASVGLDSMTHLTTLVLLELRCTHCSRHHVFREPPTSAFPALTRLETLVARGEISHHCFPLLLSWSAQCPQLRYVDFDHLSLPQGSDPSPAATPSFAPLLQAFISWLAGVNHVAHLGERVLRYSQHLMQPAAEDSAAEEKLVEYVRLCPWGGNWDDVHIMTILTPFRFLTGSPHQSSARPGALSVCWIFRIWIACGGVIYSSVTHCPVCPL